MRGNIEILLYQSTVFPTQFLIECVLVTKIKENTCLCVVNNLALSSESRRQSEIMCRISQPCWA